MELIDVAHLTAVDVSSMCRFCMKRETPSHPHYTLDWSKWPNAAISKLYERVIGQKLHVSPNLPENFCDTCNGWLIETNTKIEMFQATADMWMQYLKTIPVIATKLEPVKQEVTVVGLKEEFDEEIEYLEIDDDYEDDVDEAAGVGDGVDDDDEEEGEDEDPSISLPADECDETSALNRDSDDGLDESEVGLSTENNAKTEAKPRNRPIPSHWNANDGPVECDLCGQKFWRKYLINSHLATKHGLRRKFSCISCPKLFRTKEAYERHTEIHPAQTAFECCGHTFYSEAHVLRHQRTIHCPLQDWPCSECPKVFITKQRLANHMQRHGEKTHPCDICGRMFHMRKDVKLHKDTVHDFDHRFMCEKCGRKMKNQLAIEVHRRSCHFVSGKPETPGRRFQNLPIVAPRPEMSCTECPFKCMRPETLRRHFQRDHPKDDWTEVAESLCMKCMRQFSSPEEAEEHRTKHHPTLQCDICKKILTTEFSLERHKKTHTAKERPFTCEVCEGTYVTLFQLKAHFRRKHTDIRPFVCPTCGKRYCERSEMNEHIRAVHNTTRLPCAQCPQTFSTAKYLATHVARIHTGEFNFFKCPQCEGTYHNASVLSLHMAVHHPVMSD